MRCIFCLEEAPGSEEHVFPLAMGGSLTTDRVCAKCNSVLGSRVDAALCDSFVVRNRRAQFGLAGNSRVAPGLYELLEGVSDVAALPGKRLHSKYNEATNKIDSRLLPHREAVDMPDGSKGERVTMDLKDIGELPKILQRLRKQHGLPPLSQKEVDAKVEEAMASIQTIENPEVRFSLKLDFSFVGHALLKIVYELAFLWLGEDYLDDPMAAVLREAICKDDPSSADSIEGWIGPAADCDFFKLWETQASEHMAAAGVGNNTIVIAVRVFDAHAALIPVTKDAARYLGAADGGTKIRFLVLDSVSGRRHETTFMEELVRIMRMTGGNPVRTPAPSPFAS